MSDISLLEEVAARLALQELVARYSVARDDRDLDGLIDKFTPDCEFHRLSVVVRGREELRPWFTKSMDRYDLTLHTVHQPIFDLQGPDDATGMVNGHAELVLATVPYIAAYRYTDEYKRIDGRWYIHRRKLRFLYTVETAKYPSIFADTKRIRWAGTEPVEADYPEALPGWADYLG